MGARTPIEMRKLRTRDITRKRRMRALSSYVCQHLLICYWGWKSNLVLFLRVLKHIMFLKATVTVVVVGLHN